MSSKKYVSLYLPWVLNCCSLTLLRRHFLISWVTIRVSLTSLSSLSHSIDAGSGIEPLTSNVDDVRNVGVDKLDNEDIVDKPSTIIATCFTCDRRRKSACWRSSWQVFPHIFRSNFGEDIADLCIDCVDVQWLLALVGGGNPCDSPRRSSWTSPRTWMVPCQIWSS